MIRVGVAYLIIGWLLVQVLELAADSFEAPAWVMKMIITLLMVGFIPTLLFSWAYELTPEGLKKDKDVDKATSDTSHTAKKLDIVTLVSVAGIAALIGWQQLNPPQSTPADDQSSLEATTQASSADSGLDTTTNDASIAVLPFADLSPDGDQGYFSDGIAEEILNVLVRVDGLSVASRTSAFQFKNQDIGIPEIAKELKVRHVLEGSVRKAGDTIRVTAQLIDTTDDRHLWSETFDRPLEAANIFAIQDEIAKSIVAALGDVILSDNQSVVSVTPTTDSVTAYEQYLTARALYQARRDLDVADNLLAQALEQDDQFAEAWALRAGVQTVTKDYGYSDLSLGELEERMEVYAAKALALEPESAVAIAARANMRAAMTLRLEKRHDLGAVIADLERALAISPRDGSALNWIGLAYGVVGKLEASLMHFQQCVAYEPYYAPCVENEIDALVALGRFDEAWQKFESSADKGTMTNEYVSFSLLAHFDRKYAFVLMANQTSWFQGWRRHEEIYNAFRNLEADHNALANDLLQFVGDEPFEELWVKGIILIPLGVYDILPFTMTLWADDHAGYRQSQQFRDYILNSGIYDYWHEHGFPPQCRMVGDSGFECD